MLTVVVPCSRGLCVSEGELAVFEPACAWPWEPPAATLRHTPRNIAAVPSVLCGSYTA